MPFVLQPIYYREQKAWAEQLFLSPCTFVGHFVLNQYDLNLNEVQRLVIKFHHQLDKRLLSARPHKLPKQSRTQMITVFEKIWVNPHAHAFITPPVGVQSDNFIDSAQSAWQKLVPSGSLELKQLTSPLMKFQEAQYLSKELWKQENLEAILLLP